MGHLCAKGGTFEERNVTAWAKEQLEALLVGMEHSTPSARVRIDTLTSASGEAHVWIVRHKKRWGFEALLVGSKWVSDVVFL